MGMTSGARALQRYDGQPGHALGVSVWDDLSTHGLRVFDSEGPAEDMEEGGLGLSLGDDAVYLTWANRERRRIDRERDHNIAAVLTGAVASTLATLGYQVHGFLTGEEPVPTLIVSDRPEP